MCVFSIQITKNVHIKYIKLRNCGYFEDFAVFSWNVNKRYKGSKKHDDSPRLGRVRSSLRRGGEASAREPRADDANSVAGRQPFAAPLEPGRDRDELRRASLPGRPALLKIFGKSSKIFKLF